MRSNCEKSSDRRRQRTPARIAGAAAAAVVVTVLAVVLAACGGASSPSAHQGSATGASGSGSGAGASGTPAPTPATVAPSAALIVIKPSANSTNVDPASAIQVSVADGRLLSVTAQISGGAAVAGTLDGSAASWTSNAPVGVGHTYGVTVTAMGDDGKQATATSTFTTAEPGSYFMGTYTPDNGTTVGVGQPVSIAFDHPIADKAAVQRQLSVETAPTVSGSWHWFGNQRVDWRPQQYWAAGTKVTLHMRLDGVKSGTRYGRQNRDVTFTIGRALTATVDVNTDKMTVNVDGKTTTLLVSAGKPGFDTWEGTMVVLEKMQDIPMNSSTVGIFGVNAYDIPNVYWDVKLTMSGTFVHAAPWNEGKFGKVNGSHGCIGMSTSDAQWFFNQAIVGDPVTVVNSKSAVVPGDNGFGDWNLSWPDWIAGSAVSS